MPMSRECVEIAYRSLYDTSHPPAWSGEISPADLTIAYIKETLLRLFGPEVTSMSLDELISQLNQDELLI